MHVRPIEDCSEPMLEIPSAYSAWLQLVQPWCAPPDSLSRSLADDQSDRQSAFSCPLHIKGPGAIFTRFCKPEGDRQRHMRVVVTLYGQLSACLSRRFDLHACPASRVGASKPPAQILSTKLCMLVASRRTGMWPPKRPSSSKASLCLQGATQQV